MSNFSIFSLRVKKNLVGSESTRVKGWSASYLLRAKRKLWLRRVTAHLYLDGVAFIAKQAMRGWAN